MQATNKNSIPLDSNSVDSNSKSEAIIIYHSPRAEIFPILLFTIVALGFIPLTVVYPGSIEYLTISSRLGLQLPIPLFGLAPLVTCAWLLHRLYNFKYYIDVDHVRAQEGLISFFLRDIRIDYENVRGIEVYCSVLDRILGIGDLKVGSSIQSSIELIMNGIRNPELHREILEQRIHAYISSAMARANEKERLGGHGL